MKLTVLFDKEACEKQFTTGWGIAYLINDTILFDTGESFSYLEDNARRMDIDLKKVEKVVISHDRWDHLRGLWEFLAVNNKVTVYGCTDSKREFKEKVKQSGAAFIEVDRKLSISDSVYSTGQMLTIYKGVALAEQALVVHTEDKLVLVCGGSYPGIVQVIEKVKSDFGKQVDCALGGFHLMDKERRVIEYIVHQVYKLGVRKIGPAHCTGFEALSLFKRVFGDGFIEIKVGQEITL